MTDGNGPAGQDGRSDGDSERQWQRVPRDDQAGRTEGRTGHLEERDAAAGRDYSRPEDVRRDEILRYAVAYCARVLIWALAILAIIVLAALGVAAVVVIWTAVCPEQWEVVPDGKMKQVIAWAGSLGPHISFVSGSTLTLAVVGFARWWSRRGS